jgi:hypothetical protein
MRWKRAGVLLEDCAVVVVALVVGMLAPLVEIAQCNAALKGLGKLF